MPEIPIVERIHPDLEELLDRFFVVSRSDLDKMVEALDAGNFEELLRLGHTAKGTGSGYGFKGMGVIGRMIEAAASEGDLHAAREHVNSLARYLDTVKVEFGE